MWRQHGKGPCFIQVGRLIRYPVAEVASFERRMKFEPYRGKGIPGTAFMATPDKKVGKLRRSEFSERKSQSIIQAYLSHLLDRRRKGCQVTATDVAPGAGKGEHGHVGVVLHDGVVDAF